MRQPPTPEEIAREVERRRDAALAVARHEAAVAGAIRAAIDAGVKGLAHERCEAAAHQHAAWAFEEAGRDDLAARHRAARDEVRARVDARGREEFLAARRRPEDRP